MSDSAEKMWRCLRCKKWSHAKRKPKHHQRWVKEGEPLYASSKVDYNELDYEQPPGHMVNCGPFEPYLALSLRELIK